MFNPYQPYMNSQQIVRVNGENGAKAYQMMPNSSALLLDETAPRLFLKTTDGAGFPSISCYKLEAYVEEPAVDVHSLDERLKKLEKEILNNVKPNTSSTKRKQSEEQPD